MVQIFKSTSEPDKVCQGDIFILTNGELQEILPEEIYQMDITLNGFIVISNTCDIENDNITYINICPIVALEYMVESIRKKKKKQGKKSKDIKNSINSSINDLVGYNLKKYFYLPKDETCNIDDEWVVLIEFVLTHDRDYILPLIKKRRVCTLKNPWKEKLGWIVGTFYNRVSLENHSHEKIQELLERVKKQQS